MTAAASAGAAAAAAAAAASAAAAAAAAAAGAGASAAVGAAAVGAVATSAVATLARGVSVAAGRRLADGLSFAAGFRLKPTGARRPTIGVGWEPLGAREAATEADTELARYCSSSFVPGTALPAEASEESETTSLSPSTGT